MAYLDHARGGLRKAPNVMRDPRFFDNGPMVRMSFEVMKRIQKLQWRGCEILEARFDSMKAVFHIRPCADIPEHYEKDGFAVHQLGVVQLVWRKPSGDASDDRLCEQPAEALGAGDECA